MTEVDKQSLRTIVREEISGIKIQVDGLDTAVGSLKTDVGELKTDMRDLQVKFERFDNKMDVIAELVTTTVNTRHDVVDLRSRVETLELDVAVLKRPRP